MVASAVVEERQLLKKLRWYDGFVISLATPGFLLGSLGYSVGDLGGWGSVLLWGISAGLAFFIMTLYSEMAAMFPDKPGGFPLYAHEGWRKHFALVGPVATFGYWLGWSVVLSFLGPLQRADHPGGLVPRRAGRHADRRRQQLLQAVRRRSRSAAPDRRRADHRRLALQRPRRPRRGALRISGGRAPDDPALLLHDPAVPERRLLDLQPHVGLARRDGRHRRRGDVALHLGGGQALDRLAVDHVLVIVGRRHLRDVRARVQGHGQRHAARTALGLHLHVRRLHPPAARSRRRGRGGDRRCVRLRRGARDAHRLGGAHGLLRRRDRPELPDLDEHGDGRRRTRALRDRSGPHDDQAAVPPESPPRPGAGDDDRHGAEHLLRAPDRQPLRRPRREQHRLRARALLRDHRLHPVAT